ncbi:integral membrane [Fusarium albosuccineum]|uniref:Integral membrane n=1 Tax=Fusarium albosuccineum TaxID=1237068 RepID=A0A8H4P3K2_9HYPO|nr:integral membrane [Fusarium albosuccineum]
MGLWEVEDYGVIADRACWSMFAVTTFIVILRVITRVFVGKGRLGGLGWDDYITIFCILVMLVTCIFVTIGSHYGLGRRMEDIDPTLIPEALKWNSIISAVLIWTFSLPKFAIIAILKRILDYGLKTTILFWGLALSSQACILATSVWWFKQCNPVAFGWDKTIEGGTCASVKVMSDLGYFTSAYSAFLDVFFALYPAPFIMRLNMAFKSRVAISIALGLSILASVVSIYKLTIFGSVFEVLAEDPTYPVPFLDILGLSEGCILVVCASLPTLGPLFRLARGKLSTINSSHGPSQRVASNQGNHSESSGRWDKLRGHRLDDVENRSTGMGSSVDDIPLVSGPKQPVYGPREVYKGSFGVVSNNQRAH